MGNEEPPASARNGSRTLYQSLFGKSGQPIVLIGDPEHGGFDLQNLDITRCGAGFVCALLPMLRIVVHRSHHQYKSQRGGRRERVEVDYGLAWDAGFLPVGATSDAEQ